MQRFVGAEAWSERMGFIEFGTSLKGAKSGVTLFGNEGRAGRVVLELAAALVRARNGARIMVE